MLVLAVVLIALPQLVGSIVSDVLGFVGIGLMLALGLNIIVGNAGLLHLGFVVFYTIGAYTTALLMGASPVTALGIAPPVLPFHLSFYAALPIVMAVAALIGVLIAAPTVRLRGDYLAIVTLGFGAIASGAGAVRLAEGRARRARRGSAASRRRRCSGSRCGARSTSTTWRSAAASSASSSPGD